MALKLLVMFVEYTPNNALLLRDAVVTIDRQSGSTFLQLFPKLTL